MFGGVEFEGAADATNNNWKKKKKKKVWVFGVMIITHEDQFNESSFSP